MPVGREIECQQLLGMAAEQHDGLARAQVPKAGSAAEVACGHERAVAVEGQRVDLAAMALQQVKDKDKTEGSEWRFKGKEATCVERK